METVIGRVMRTVVRTCCVAFFAAISAAAFDDAAERSVGPPPAHAQRVPSHSDTPPVPSAEAWSRDRALLDFTQQSLAADSSEKNRVLRFCSLISIAQRVGNYDLATKLADEAIALVEDPSYGASEGAASVVLDDERAFFSGEVFEKVMLYYYRAVLAFRDGDWPRSRALLVNALLWDRNAVDERYRDDFAAVHWLLAHTYLRLGEFDNARIAVEKFNKWVSKRNQMSLEQIRDDNFLAVVQFGVAPRKEETGSFSRFNYLERGAELFDGARSIGRTLPGADLYFQATTRGRSARVKAESAKATAMYLSLFLPYNFLIFGTMKGTHWGTSDVRAWAMLPGEVGVFSAHLDPGVHDLHVRFLSGDDAPLGRIEINVPHLVVAAAAPTRDTVLLLESPTITEKLLLPDPKTIGNKSVRKFALTTTVSVPSELHPAVCFDRIGHTPGSKSFLQGGTCYCSPTPSTVKDWQDNGVFAEMTVTEIRQRFEDLGYRLPGAGHADCNNLCDAGPHAALGGKCLASPIPGTRNYVEVILAKSP